MTAATIAELMVRRIALVEKLSALNAQHVRHTQACGGIEIELLSCAADIERDGETPTYLACRGELEDRLARTTALCADCDRELDALAEKLNELDRRLAEL